MFAGIPSGRKRNLLHIHSNAVFT